MKNHSIRSSKGWLSLPPYRSSSACILIAGLAPILKIRAASDFQEPAPEIVITANRAQRESMTIPASVTILGAHEILNSPGQTIPDLLRNLTGVVVADLSGSGRASAVDIRGFGETATNNTLVLVNGRRVNSNDIADVDWTAIPLHQVDRIEIIRGGGSVLYGDKAVGGVINILTKTGAEKTTLSSETTVGSYNSFSQSLSLSGRASSLLYTLRSGYSDSEGYRTNNVFRNKTSGLDLSLQGTGPLSLTASFGLKEDHYGMPGYVLRGAERHSSLTPLNSAGTEGFFLQATPQLRLDETSKIELALQYSETKYTSVFSDPTWSQTNRWRVSELGLKPSWDTTFDTGPLEHKLKVGVDYTRTTRSPIEDPYYPQTISRDETGGYFSDQIALIPQRLFLDAGYRFDRVRYEYPAGPKNRSFSIHAGKIGLTFPYAPRSKVFVSLDRSFRNMLLTGEQAGNPILPPQTSLQSQLGVQHEFCRFFSAGMTAFHINTRDEIFYDPHAGSFGSNSNYPKTQRSGLEFSMSSDPLKSLHLYTNYTLLNSKLQGGRYDGKEVPMTARHSAQAGACWSPIEQIELDLRGRWSHHRYAISDWNNLRRDWEGNDFVVVDARLTYKPRPWLKIYVGMNNLLDRKYSEWGTYSDRLRDAVLYPCPGRNWQTGVTFSKEF